MNTSQALLIYLIFVIFVFGIFIHIRIRIWSAIILTLLLGQILLNILCSPANLTPWSPDGESLTSASALYIVIQILTPVLVLLYVFVYGWFDRVPLPKMSKQYRSK